MVAFSDESIESVGKVLLDKQKPLKERFRALFALKNIGGNLAIEYIKQCFSDDSCLLKHELAYCLGQMQDKVALPVLYAVLQDNNQEPMVRHEAAEAIGAIGDCTSVSILEKYLEDPSVEVRETCEIALDRLKWLQTKLEKKAENIFSSVDPAPPLENLEVDKLKNMLMDKNLSLFSRYQSMFSLRDIAAKQSSVEVSKKAVEALGEALVHVDSALFRHELAFVLGQLQSPVATGYLKQQLTDLNENEMVRHECAEALGAIATEQSMAILNEFLTDDKRVVKESCEVALDIGEYFTNDDFQYADTLSKVK